MTFNYLLWSIAKPSQLIVLGALLTVVCWRWPLGRWFGIATAALVIVFGVAPIGALVMKPLEARFAIPSDLRHVDGIVVLAGAERVAVSEFYRQPQLGPAGDRFTTFLMLANRYPQARLVHTGAYEWEIARALLLGTGLPPSRIEFENSGRNTCASAQATEALVRPRDGDRWLLVTSASHMPRSMACFRAVGWEVIPYPADFSRGPNIWSVDLVDNLNDLDVAAHEWLGLAYYRLRGYTNELFPAPR